MTDASRPRTNRERLRDYRARLRAKGLRPVQFWVPDVGTDEFKREAHRQSLVVAQSPYADEDQEWLDSVSEFQVN
jgi:hypothetical protein